jgi:hypothetical protein
VSMRVLIGMQNIWEGVPSEMCWTSLSRLRLASFSLPAHPGSSCGAKDGIDLRWRFHSYIRRPPSPPIAARSKRTRPLRSALPLFSKDHDG